MTLAVEIQDAEISAAFARLQQRLGNLSPVMRAISLDLVGIVEDAFAREADPVTGVPWDPLSPLTIRRREKLGRWPGKILQQTGRLAASITPSHSGTEAAAGTNDVRAGVLQFGAAAGAFGSTARGRPIPFGDIPARPFLGLSEEGRQDILDLLVRYLE